MLFFSHRKKIKQNKTSQLALGGEVGGSEVFKTPQNIYTPGTGKIAQQLRVTTPLLEDPGLIPNTNMVLHLTPGDTVPSTGLFRRCMHVVQRHMKENVHTHKNRNNV